MKKRVTKMAKQLLGYGTLGVCSNGSYRVVCLNDGLFDFIRFLKEPLIVWYLRWENLPLWLKWVLQFWGTVLVTQLTLKGYLLAGELLQDVIKPFLGAASSSGGLQGLPGPGGPTHGIPVIPDSEGMDRNSPSWSEEFPTLRMPSPQLRELDALTRELAPATSCVPEIRDSEEPQNPTYINKYSGASAEAEQAAAPAAEEAELAPEISGVEAIQEEEEPPFQIAGETVEYLAFRINCQYNNLELATEEATKLLSKKYEVLQELDRLDPGQGWLVDGATFIQKTDKGQYTWRTLTSVLQDLRKHGTLSKYFCQFWKSRRGQ